LKIAAGCFALKQIFIPNADFYAPAGLTPSFSNMDDGSDLDLVARHYLTGLYLVI